MVISKTVAVMAVAGVLLAGCGGSSKKDAAGPSSSSSSTASSATLTKAEFLAKMNKVCSDVNGEINKLPEPSGPTDYANVVTNLQGTTKLFPAFLGQVDSLVGQSPDKVELQSKWVTPEKDELGKFSAAAQKVIADAQAHSAAKVETDIGGLNEANTNSKTIGSYLDSYGLTECAKLEDS